VNGIGAGHQDEGTKTIVPHYAFAKLDLRLVPDQTPTRIVELIEAHLERVGMSDIEVVVQDAVVKPLRTPPDHWFAKECAKILERSFGQPPILQPSSPASGTAHPFVELLGAPIFGIGLTHHGARLHAPDENILIEHFTRMSDSAAAIFNMLSARARQSEN
jgi:acetylornithine deacetylase/succinyl-diaminopimelate desuccinylase-like protein